MAFERRRTMGRNRRFWGVVIAWGMLALLGLPVTGARAAPPSVPLQNTTRLSFTITGVKGSVATFHELHAGEATDFGRFILLDDGTVDTSSGAFSGNFTQITANSDLVYGTFVGGFTGAQSGLYSTGSLAFTGGTGRFQALMGSATFQGHRDPGTGVVTLAVEATISY
jgi:hypothetical protein